MGAGSIVSRSLRIAGGGTVRRVYRQRTRPNCLPGERNTTPLASAHRKNFRTRPDDEGRGG